MRATTKRLIRSGLALLLAVGLAYLVARTSTPGENERAAPTNAAGVEYTYLGTIPGEQARVYSLSTGTFSFDKMIVITGPPPPALQQKTLTGTQHIATIEGENARIYTFDPGLTSFLRYAVVIDGRSSADISWSVRYADTRRLISVRTEAQ